VKNIIHLHRHSEFSLLDGTGTAKQYAERAVELDQPALALTDHGTLAGALEHHKACNDVGILPIMGIEAYFKPNRHLKDKDNKTYYHLVLHAKDLNGWKNLMRLSSEAYTSGFYYKPCLDWELLELYSEGIICQTACVSSYMNRAFLRGDDNEVNVTIQRLKSIFRDDLFIEIMPHDFDDQRILNIHLANLAQEQSVPLIATVDAHFPYADWADTQDILIMMSTGQTFEKRKIKKDETGEDTYLTGCPTAYLMDRQEVVDTFQKYHPDLPLIMVETAINNTHEVYDRVQPVELSKHQKMPKVEVDPEAQVKQWCVAGMMEKGLHDKDEYWDRLEYEFGVLKKNDVLDYFVIVGDLVRWAIDHGIRVGAGRGSAAGSLVSYLIGITQLDPIAHGLLFERFLNPDRKGMPDIDLDFQADRRDEVKAYAASKYGEDHVADICALQTFKPRACIQKVGRVFDLNRETYTATENVDPLEKRALDRLAQVDQLIGSFKDTYPDIWKHAVRLQDQRSTQSKHAGGVVITDRPLSDYIPTMIGKKGETLTQWDGRALDEYGLMKIDFLGIKGLAMQEYACDLIEKSGHERPDLNSLPVMRDPNECDRKVLDVFNRGLVLGVFQFTGSAGFSRLIRSIGADWIGDLGAANAIYRPGPLGGGVDRSYAARKKKQEPVQYYHESAEAALRETYGLIVYQEQIMELAKRMAGFTGGQADDLRKAMSKEYRFGLEHVKQWLKDKGYVDMWWSGCRDNSIKDAIIDEVWKNILAFGEYGFNKSHAYAYAVQSYQDAWLKAYYPSEFYASLLTFDSDLAMAAVRESRAFGVEFSGPDINCSSFGFTIDSGRLLFGLNGVKYLGDKGIQAVIEGQPYRSVEDFEERVAPRACNKRAKLSLRDAGAFDSFGLRSKWTNDRKAEAEKEAIGVALSQSNTLRKYKEFISDMVTPYTSFLEKRDGAGIVVGGEVVSTRVIKTRNKKEMAFLTVNYDYDTEYSCTVFPEEYLEFNDLLEEGKPVMIRGRKETRPNGDTTVIVDTMVGIEELALEMADDGD
jgi:DNA polymerase-3 subunit alpha